MARRIDDHSFWAGKGSKYPLPDGAKMKGVSNVEGDGGVMNYRDTEQSIASEQKRGVSKMKSYAQPSGDRY